ncbi:MAG: hypothetical protein QXE05_12935 [Nitrososphaeria archaeon]
MTKEFRLYYESIEQAYHYVLPVVQEALKTESMNIEVKLVKLGRNYTYYSRKLAPIIFWKVPDILMSVVQDDEEYPLLLIEFSTAVFTEDHELQRFDGMVVAAKNNCIYTKISPTKKKSPYEHGGKVEFDYTQPFRLIYSRYNKPYFHFEWQCDEKGVVETNPEYLSCPKQIPEFEILLSVIVKEITKNGYSQDWIDKVCKLLQNNIYFREWLSKLRSIFQVDISALNTSRTRWIGKDSLLNSGVLEVKLNRFGHAMDPERGMLAYYGTLTPNVISKMVFSRSTDAWYKNIPKEEEIKRFVNKGLANIHDFLYCFALGSGLHTNEEFMSIVEKYEKCTKNNVIIDLTEFIQKNFLNLSKPLKTIFSFSKLFVIEDDMGQRRVIFRWEPYQESQAYEDYPKVTSIVERKMFDEDDVTYIVVHNVLKPNGYKIVAVSYPGAQGDRRILVQAGTGRRQPRKYIDIISFLPKKVTCLEENVGIYTRPDVQENIDELSKYKGDEAYIRGLRNFKEAFAPESVDTVTKIGVGFWASKNFTTIHIRKLDLKDLDYFVYITHDRKQWKIWRTGEDNMFKITNGTVHIPKTYDIQVSKISSINLNLFQE